MLPRSLARLIPLLLPYWRRLGLSVGGLLFGTLLGLAGPWIVSQAIDVDLANGDRAGLAGKAGAYLVLVLASLAATYTARIGIEIAAQHAMVALKTLVFDHLIDHDLALHDKQTSGRLITRVQGDVEALRMLLSEVVLHSPADLLLFVGMFTIISATAPDLVPLVAMVLPPWVLLFIAFRRIAPPRFVAVRKIRARLTGFFTEHIRAMPTLQAFARTSWARERAEDLNRDVFDAEVAAHLQPVWYFNGIFLVRNLGIVVMLWIGAGQVADGRLTVGALVMGLGYLRQLFNPLMRLSHHLSTIERARAAADRVGELLDTPRAITDPPEPVTWPGLRTALRLEDIAFAYVEGTPVLRGISLEIPAGADVGIVGSTGAGKSTILSLLLRFRDPTSGRVTIDGVDLRELRLDDVRRHMGLVLQDVHLMPGTLLENLGGDRDAAARALATVGVDLSLDREISDSELSRGERQLLTFARALVSDPEILVLDEATSAVDPATEVAVQAALARLQAGRTTITVAHRLATVRHCDAIYVLHQGVLAERGTHDELLAAGGIYADLARLQEVA